MVIIMVCRYFLVLACALMSIYLSESLNKIPFWWMFSVISFNLDQDRHSVGLDLGSNCMQSLSEDDKCHL